MKFLDFVAVVPAIIVGIFVAVWLVRGGDQPIKSNFRFFGTAFLIAVALALWSAGLDTWAESPWESWAIHLAVSYLFPSACVLVCWVRSLFYPVFRRA